LLKSIRKRLGDILIEAGKINDQQLKQGLELQKEKGIPLGKAIVQLGFITQQEIIVALGDQLGIPYVSLTSYQIDTSTLALIQEPYARENRLIPLFKIANALTVAMVDPLDVFTIDDLSNKTDMEIETAICSEEELNQVLDQYYGSTSSVDEVVQIIQDQDSVAMEDELDEISIKDGVDEAPVIKLVNLFFTQAIKEKVSDIHIEPEEDLLRIRFRIDGILNEAYVQPKNLQNAIISRIKIMAEMNIAERRIPQDGRFQVKIEGREVDVRVSTFPTVNGENVVMRILDKTNVIVNLEDLGLIPRVLKEFRKLLVMPYGILLVTGPTGSGKTTTLYSALHSINAVDRNIITVEDPVEYRLKMIRQSQVNPKAGLTFAAGLRAILRQDPDIIMVGEIRDSETANIAVQSALTGHLVLSTLHTNDAPGAITRLVDMNVEPFLVSSSCAGVIAQRLVRKICPKCKESYKPSKNVIKELNISSDGKDYTFYKGAGCRHCKGSGYKGRIGIFELMMVDEEIRDMIVGKATTAHVRRAALKAGMKSLRHDGIIKVLNGITTIEEVIRVTQID